MRKFAGILLLLVGAGAAAARWLDLASFTDADTGFCLVGSVWVRYAVVAVLLAVGLLASCMASRRPAAAEGRSIPLLLTAGLSAAAFAAAGAMQLAVCWQQRSFSALETARAVLALAAAWWLAAQAICWAGHGDARPAGGVAGGVIGSLFFFLLTFQRFVTNYSSIYRIAQSTQVFSALAALVLTAVLLRVCTFPESRWGRKLYLAGIEAFYLCTCLELPQAVFLWQNGKTTLADLSVSGALAMLGLMGAAASMAALSREKVE